MYSTIAQSGLKTLFDETRTVLEQALQTRPLNIPASESFLYSFNQIKLLHEIIVFMQDDILPKLDNGNNPDKARFIFVARHAQKLLKSLPTFYKADYQLIHILAENLPQLLSGMSSEQDAQSIERLIIDKVDKSENIKKAISKIPGADYQKLLARFKSDIENFFKKYPAIRANNVAWQLPAFLGEKMGSNILDKYELNLQGEEFSDLRKKIKKIAEKMPEGVSTLLSFLNPKAVHKTQILKSKKLIDFTLTYTINTESTATSNEVNYFIVSGTKQIPFHKAYLNFKRKLITMFTEQTHENELNVSGTAAEQQPPVEPAIEAVTVPAQEAAPVPQSEPAAELELIDPAAEQNAFTAFETVFEEKTRLYETINRAELDEVNDQINKDINNLNAAVTAHNDSLKANQNELNNILSKLGKVNITIENSQTVIATIAQIKTVYLPDFKSTIQNTEGSDSSYSILLRIIDVLNKSNNVLNFDAILADDIGFEPELSPEARLRTLLDILNVSNQFNYWNNVRQNPPSSGFMDKLMALVSDSPFTTFKILVTARYEAYKSAINNNDSIATIETTITNLENNLQALANSQTVSDKAKNRLLQLNAQQQENKNQLDQYAQLAAELDILRNISGVIKDYRMLEQKITALKDKLAKANSVEELKNGYEEIAELTANQIKSLEKKLSELKNGTAAERSAEMASALTSLDSGLIELVYQLSEINENYKQKITEAINNEFKQLETKVKLFAEQIADSQPSVSNYKAYCDHYKVLVEDIAALKGKQIEYAIYSSDQADPGNMALLDRTSVTLNEAFDSVCSTVTTQLNNERLACDTKLANLNYVFTEEVSEFGRLKQEFSNLSEQPVINFELGDTLIANTQSEQELHAAYGLFKDARRGLRAGIEAVQDKFNKIEARITKRKAIKEEIGQQLDKYLSDAHSQHVAKDFVYKNGEKQRQDVINAIKSDVDAFVSSGDSAALLLAVKTVKKNAGDTLRPVLNRILVQITDYKKAAPANLEQGLVAIVPVDHQRAVDALTQRRAFANATSNITVKNKQNAQLDHLDTLNLQISEMKAYGEKIKTKSPEAGQCAAKLAAALQQRIDDLIVNHADKFNNHQFMKQFAEDFKVLLHSQDDMMGKHRSVWLPIVADIINTLTLFIPAAVSKLFTGHAFFISFNTERENQIGKMDKTASGIVPPAA
ncbi:hypothetical protein ACFORL_00915 [Legionella dresdenensis]|uniref:Uncharacterized protein n=2 Tax=Legionella dresdenensis TaxID=450200 RepID=A0ABV8CBF8_9GAMM